MKLSARQQTINGVITSHAHRMKLIDMHINDYVDPEAVHEDYMLKFNDKTNVPSVKEIRNVALNMLTECGCPYIVMDAIQYYIKHSDDDTINMKGQIDMNLLMNSDHWRCRCISLMGRFEPVQETCKEHWKFWLDKFYCKDHGGN